MAWKPHFAEREPNIDPFDAPDPIMPGGEPELEPPRERPDADDGIGRMARRNERKEPGHRAHRAQRATPARTGGESEPSASPIAEGEATRAHAPSREGRVTAPRATSDPGGRRARPPRSPSSTKPRRRFGCIALLIIVIAASGILGDALSSCSGCADSLFAGLSGNDGYSSDTGYYDYASDFDAGYDYDYEAYDTAQSELAEATEQATQDELQRLVAGEDPYAEIVAESFSYTFGFSSDFGPEEIGLDTAALAQKILAASSYEVESVYAFGDATDNGFSFECSSYFYLHLPDIYYLGDQVGAYAARLRPNATDARDFTEDDLRKITDYFDSELARSELSDAYECMEFSASADAEGTVTEGPTLLEDDWTGSFASRAGAFDYAA